MSHSRSITEYFYTEPEGHRCLYCGSDDTCLSRGMWAHRLTCEDYQDLIDRGWSRAGKYCYKPDMSKSCCPGYMIRCRVADFRLTNSQRRVLNRMNAFLVQGVRRKSKKAASSDNSASGPIGDCTPAKLNTSASAPSARFAKPLEIVCPPAGQRPGPSKPPCQKDNATRKKHRRVKLAVSSADERYGNDMPITLGVASTVDSPALLSKSESGQSEASSCASYTTPTSTPSKGGHDQDEGSNFTLFLDVDPDGKRPIETCLRLPTSDVPPAHKLDMEWIRSSPPSDRFKATFKSSHALYQKYQMAIHGDSREKSDEEMFRRFLCDSPLIPIVGEQGWPCDYGSYHQHYTLDGQLVVVAVVDILPYSLYLVYLFYDPDFSFLSLGVYSNLREIEITRRLHRSNPAFEFYYTGYYVHNCQKSCYKANFSPSFLLCPEAYSFVPIELCLSKLEVHKYTRLLDESEEKQATPACDDVIVLIQCQIMPYGIFRALCGSAQELKVSEYAKLVGPSVASRMLLYLNFDVNWL